MQIFLFKLNFTFLLKLFYITLFLFISSCSDDPDPVPQLPQVITTQISSITSTSAKSGGVITDDGGSKITKKGIVWGGNSNPTIEENSGNTSDGYGSDPFESDLKELRRNSSYFARAYASNVAGTSYGEEFFFNTEAELPRLTTAMATAVSLNSVYGGGEVIDDGGSEITEVGLVWSTRENPTIEDNNGSALMGNGNDAKFSDTIYELKAFENINIRAYAKNQYNTSYGNNITISTAAFGNGITDIDGNFYTTIIIGNQEWIAKNLNVTRYANGDPIVNLIENDAWMYTNSGAWASLYNDNKNDDTFGKLYNWYAVVDERNICPNGWHVPTDSEWTVFQDYLDPPMNPSDYDPGGSYSRFGNSAGGKMKTTGIDFWKEPNNYASNESKFNGLPGGDRDFNGDFNNYGEFGFWWSSSFNEDFNKPYSRYLVYSDRYLVQFYSFRETSGMYVRCIKN